MSTLDLNENLDKGLLRECAAQYQALARTATHNGVLETDIVDVLAHPAFHMRQMMFPMLMTDAEACEAVGFLRAVAICKEWSIDDFIDALQKVLASPERHALRL